jgi:amino acid adenylation domain-containing protein/thioester reductase-like protein
MKKDVYDLTNPQMSIWMTEQFYSNTNINNIVGYLKINKKTDFKALEKAVNYFFMKNDSFKTKITLENSKPKQYFDDFVYENIEIIDLKDEIQLLDFENSFPMKQLPILDHFLFLTKLLRFPNGTGIFVITAHHLIADAWTMTLLLEEIYQNYSDITNGKEIDLTPNPSYSEFIKSQSTYMTSDKFEKDKEFWQGQFETLPNVVSFKNNSKVSIHANRKVYSFDKSLANQISEFCKENSISDYIFLFSIFNIYFKNIFNSNNFIIGNPVLNRSNFKEKHMTGMFVSIMPFIVDLSKSSSFLDFCHKMASNQKQMYRHIRFPYHEILNFVRKTHDFSDSLYDIVFSYQNATIPSYCKWLPNRSQAESLQIHIKNIAEEKDNLSIHYDFLTDIFSEEDINLMHKRILNLIHQVLKQPDQSIENLEIISPSEKTLLLKTFNDTKVKYNKNSNIIKEFEKIVEQYPKNIAIMDKNTSYTYQELNERANFLAKIILEQKISTDIIAFSLTRSVNIIVTILAILKSGHTYMPIDPEYPIDRINFMLENSGTKVLITTKEFFQKIDYTKTCLLYEDISFEEKTNNLNLEIEPDTPCYIMYTSGSTGIPKAVTIKHYNVLNFVKSMQERLNYVPSSDNKVLSVTTVCFDIFVFELFPTLLSGLTLVMADELESRSPKLLSDMIQKYQITKILTTPSRIELLFCDDAYTKTLSNINEFILGGEPLPATLLQKLQTNTKANIFNLYGPTETTVYSTFKDVTNSNFITIGTPINNTQVYVLNNSNHLQPIGQIGEICIGGDGVGAGYYKNKEKTDSVFVPNPYENDIIYKTGDLGYWKPNGELVCLGRKDHQIKIRGYRVELDDISNHILTYGNIDKCVVIDKIDANNKKYLCAYLVCQKDIDMTELKKYLVDILPHYMIPSYFVRIDKIPLTLNHKVDRKSLPEPNLKEVTSSTKYIKPANKIQRDLCHIFETCLSLSKVGIENDIFDYHIDSLDIIRVQTKMLEYNYKLNTQDFYQHRTIKSLAEFIENKNNQTTNTIDTSYLSNVNNSFNKHPSIMQFAKKHYSNILLLGCTGYLGIHLLQELLTNSACHITCIVRSKNEEDVTQRLSSLYRFYFNQKLPLDRITLINSDITKSRFGLSVTEYKELAKTIDLAINTAANVKYYGDYEQFRKINVGVVENLIDFCTKYSLPFTHISTLGVSGNYLVNHQKNYNDFSENNFYIEQKYDENVYIQTKFEAEKLIYEKTLEGLNATILRVGNLTGRYSDGGFQQNFEANAFYNILMMILKYHILPNTMVNEFLEFTPVDYCAKAIFELIFNMETSHYVFHLFNENYIRVSELLKIFKELGFQTEILSGNEFKKKIIALSNQYPEENILKGIVNDLDDTLGLSFTSTVNQKNSYTNSCLEKLNFEWSKITLEYIEKIITYLRKKKYLS